MDIENLSYPIGKSDFRKLRRDKNVYVDKTKMIEELIRSGGEAFLFPRPRRFGKTLNLSMLRYFFEKSSEDRAYLFQGLAIEQSAIAKPHFQKHPVIFLTFKDIKATTWETCFAEIIGVLSALCQEHEYLLQNGNLGSQEEKSFRSILEQKASPEQYARILLNLSRQLTNYHNIETVILIDEYDTPIHSAFVHGYYDQAIGFFRTFLSTGLKDNVHLFRGVLTGILRLAKESIFSGLNNMVVYSLLQKDFSSYFGFTEPEVQTLTQMVGQPELINGLREWYNGYLFGGQVIYNPWSILNFLNSTEKKFQPYWVSTSSNDLLKKLLFQGPFGVQQELEDLLQGKAIEKPIHESISLHDLVDDAVWNFLLFAGYLKPKTLYTIGDRQYASLVLPNREVIAEFESMTASWFQHQVGTATDVKRFLEGLLKGEAATVQQYLTKLLLETLSYHDLDSRSPERVYRAFLLGLLVNLGNQYEIRSNRESGEGRYDIMVLPKQAGQPGIVLELKSIKKDSEEQIESAINQAFAQIKLNHYATELRAREAQPIYQLAAVFSGKQVTVKRFEETP